LYPLLIALISAVTTASLVIAAVNYSLRRKRQPSTPKPAARWMAASDEGSVVLPLRATEKQPAQPKLKKSALAALTREQQAVALHNQVDDVISRFILKS